MLSLWLQKDMFWVSEQKLVDQANSIRRNGWMTEFEETRSVEALPDHVGEDVRNVLPEMGEEGQTDSLDEEEIAIVMEIAEVIERGRKDKLPALRNAPKKKLLEETAEVDKVLSKFKTHSITINNELFHAGAVVVTYRLQVKIGSSWEKGTNVEVKVSN